MVLETINMWEVLEEQTVLAGAADGANTLAKLITLVTKFVVPTTILLDFRKIDVATSSYLREAILGFRDYCRNSRPELYPVICNLGSKVREELDALLRLKGDALVVAETDAGGVVTATVVGKLEEKQRVTLLAVLHAKRVDAVSLSRQDQNENLGPTAWNNRLASLSAKGILRETQTGRAKIYEPVLEALCYGN
jgi:hypothetical protein